jgi:hypothetical protein
LGGAAGATQTLGTRVRGARAPPDVGDRAHAPCAAPAAFQLSPAGKPQESALREGRPARGRAPEHYLDRATHRRQLCTSSVLEGGFGCRHPGLTPTRGVRRGFHDSPSARTEVEGFRSNAGHLAPGGVAGESRTQKTDLSCSSIQCMRRHMNDRVSPPGNCGILAVPHTPPRTHLRPHARERQHASDAGARVPLSGCAAVLRAA